MRRRTDKEIHIEVYLASSAKSFRSHGGSACILRRLRSATANIFNTDLMSCNILFTEKWQSTQAPRRLIRVRTEEFIPYAHFNGLLSPPVDLRRPDGPHSLTSCRQPRRKIRRRRQLLPHRYISKFAPRVPGRKMAVHLVKQSKEEAAAILEAAAAGFRSAELLFLQLSHKREKSAPQPDYREIADFAVGNFKKVISMLNRTGRARFRSGPVAPVPPVPPPPPQPKPRSLAAPPPLSMTIDFSKPSLSSDSRKKRHAHVNCEAVSGGRCDCSKRKYLFSTIP